MNVSKDIVDYLVPKTNLVFATTLFREREPMDPPNCVTIYNVPGSGPFTDYEPNTVNMKRYVYGFFQVRVRAITADTGMARAWEILKILDRVGGVTINGTLYSLIKAVDTPHILGWDESQRVLVVNLFEIQYIT